MKVRLQNKNDFERPLVNWIPPSAPFGSLSATLAPGASISSVNPLRQCSRDKCGCHLSPDGAWSDWKQLLQALLPHLPTMLPVLQSKARAKVRAALACFVPDHTQPCPPHASPRGYMRLLPHLPVMQPVHQRA
jgi:hypothetical protein